MISILPGLKYVREQWAPKRPESIQAWWQQQLQAICRARRGRRVAKAHAVGVDPKNKELPNKDKMVYIALSDDGRILTDVFTGSE